LPRNKHTSKNGYFKFYGSFGEKCRIKCSVDYFPTEVIIKFKRPQDAKWLMQGPKKEFRSESEIIRYITKHLETTGTVFKVVPQQVV